MDKQIDNVVAHIRDLERKLGEADNNLRYIKVVQALKHSLDKLYSLLLKDTSLQRKYQSTYMVYFYGGNLSFYNRFAIPSWITSTATDLSKSSLMHKVNVSLIINTL